MDHDIMKRIEAKFKLDNYVLQHSLKLAFYSISIQSGKYISQLNMQIIAAADAVNKAIVQTKSLLITGKNMLQLISNWIAHKGNIKNAEDTKKLYNLLKTRNLIDSLGVW